jgi:thiol-disulfide isomerase/thioredoxin
MDADQQKTPMWKKIAIGAVVVVLVYMFFFRKPAPPQAGLKSFSGAGLSSPKVTLFYRHGCPPCDRMMPTWQKIEQKFGAQVTKVDCGAKINSSLGGCKATPTIVARDGREHNGARTEEALSAFIQSVL